MASDPPGNRLILRAAVFPHQATDGDQVGDVGHRFAIAPLVAMQISSPGEAVYVALIVEKGTIGIGLAHDDVEAIGLLS